MKAQPVVAERHGNVLVLGRPPGAAQLRKAAIARLRQRLARNSVIYAVRRAHDPGFAWLVVDFVLIEGRSVECITADIAQALGCFDPSREVGVKLRRAASPDILGETIDGRLSTLLFGLPDALGHAVIA